MNSSAIESIFVVGSYTNSSTIGLSVFALNLLSAEVSLIDSLEISNASYLSFSEKGNLLYVTNESGNNIDSISLLKFHDGKIALVSSTSANGSAPCYVSINKNLNHAFAANYNDGSLIAIPLTDGGNFSAGSQVIRHFGSSKNQDRQECSHPHCAELSPDEKFLVMTDLGADKIYVYAYDSESKNLPLTLPPFFETNLSNGTGPRHLLFSNDGNFVYVLGELTAVIIVYRWQSGLMTLLEEVNMMPEIFNGENCAADMHFSSDGNFLYTSNRGTANEIIIFSVNKESGLLTVIGRQPTLGNGPRNFGIHPSGEFLIVAHQYSNDIRVFKVDLITGSLSDTNISIPIHSPVCVKFIL